MKWMILLASLCACASVGARVNDTTPLATLTVQNDMAYDLAVYVAHEGAPGRRLDGYVTSNSKRTFALQASDFGNGEFQLFGKFIGGARPVLSAQEVAIPGAHYTWQLGPGPTAAFLWQHADGEVVLDSTKVCRASSCRSSTQAARFKRLTGFPKGRSGWVVDHMKPLECGGEDLPTNMQWQTVDEAKAKDKIERDCTRWLR